MKCLINKDEIEPFHIFEKRTLLNKPIAESDENAVAKMLLGYSSSSKHISSSLISEYNHEELIEKIYTELYKHWAHTGLPPTTERYTVFTADYIKKLAPKRSKVLEIGCHDGFLLNSLQLEGHSCVGVEPSPFADYAKETYNLDVKKEFFTEGMFARDEFDVLIMRHVLEHVPDPQELINSALRTLKPGGIAYIEVPNSLWSLENSFFPEFHVDHISYFTIASLEYILESSGMCEIIQSEQYSADRAFPFLMATVRKSSTDKKNIEKNWMMEFKVEEAIKKFPQDYERYLLNLKRLGSEKSMVVWGTGSIGTQFAVDGEWSTDNIKYVDPNPLSQGNFLSVTGHPVESPEVIRKINPDIIMVASAWEQDVKNQVKPFLKDHTKVMSFSDLI